MVSFSDVIRSTSLCSISLEADWLEKSDKLWSLLFDCDVRTEVLERFPRGKKHAQNIQIEMFIEVLFDDGFKRRHLEAGLSASSFSLVAFLGILFEGPFLL